MDEWATTKSNTDTTKVNNNMILNEVEVDGDRSDDEMKTGTNEYDITDKFINDATNEEDSDVSFYLQRNSKRRQDFDNEQQAGPSSKKTRIEEIIENYETLDGDSSIATSDLDVQRERKNTVKHGREKKIIHNDLDDLEIEEGADLEDFTGKSKSRDYTYFLEDYSQLDAFKPISENPESVNFSEKNVFR